MKMQEQYNDQVDYKNLLTKYIEFLYHQWITTPANVGNYPSLINRIPRFSFASYAAKGEFNQSEQLCAITGELRSLTGVGVCDCPNMTYYKLFIQVLHFGVTVEVVVNQVSVRKRIFSNYHGTVAELIAQFGC